MILEYGGKNCWSFKEWLHIDMGINKNVPKEYGFGDAPAVPIMCFEGANASGKSCALRVLNFICDFCWNSFNYLPNGNILYNTFFNNQDKSEFIITFAFPEKLNTVYTYEVVMDTKKVYSEIIYTKEDNKRKVIIKRVDNRVTINHLYENSKIILRNNASVVSTLRQYGIKEIAPFYDFFQRITSNVTYISTNSDPKDVEGQFYYEHPEILKSFVVPQIKRFDTGIKDIKIKKITDENNKDYYLSWFIHETEQEDKELPYFSQSTGTQCLYTCLKDVYLALSTGGVMVFDELDCHLHYLITRELLDLFMDTSINKKHAQLIFTSHSPYLLDFAKKYRSYLFNKEHGESFCYRIDEIKEKDLLRNDRSLEPIYKSGLIGGIPNVKKN